MIYSAVTEQALLCCMLMDVETARNAVGMLVEDDFYLSQNRDVFRAIAALVEKNMVPDLPMISAELNRQGTAERVGMDTLSQIATAEGTTINANKYIADLQEMGWMRRCGAKGQALTEAANKGNAEAIYSLLDELKGDNVKGDVPQNAAEIMAGYVQELDASRKNGNKLNGLSSGFVDVDMYLGGLCKGDLLILAARPSMGKTALTGDFLRNVARKLPENAVCVFFSLEMDKKRIVSRLYCGDTGANNVVFSIHGGNNVEWADFLENLSKEGSRFEKMAEKIIIDDRPGLAVTEMRKVLHGLKSRGKEVAFVVIDYIQLIAARGENRNQELSKVSAGLKNIAREFSCPVMALSQLSRLCEMRADHRPMLSDLRESGAIEQDADVVMFLYRDEYYFPDTERKNQAELILAKNRNGPTGTVDLIWRKECTSFRSFSKWNETKEKGPWE